MFVPFFVWTLCVVWSFKLVLPSQLEENAWLCTYFLYVVFVCNACELYQVGERGQVHADGDYTAGEAKLAEPSVSLREKRGEVEPTAGQHRPCC